MPRPSSLIVLFALLASPRLALAADGFAEPPPREPALVAARDPRDATPPERVEDDAYLTRSTLRFFAGPMARVGDGTTGGLLAGIDIGDGPAGVRFSGSWARSCAANDRQQYGAELWLDFGVGKRLRPILGAGGGVARVVDPGITGGTETSTLGIGILRAALQYVLPVNGADARAGVEITGNVPAIRGSDDRAREPWLILGATVGVGF
jgi:hypothetical protein